MTVRRRLTESLLALADGRSLPAATSQATLILVAIGIALRVWDFRTNHSLNHDDICLALNVIGRSAGGLMHTLDFDQAAPLGFLWIERAMVRVIGPGEQALRLLPFLFGCASVVLISRLATMLLPPFEAIAVVGFFGLSQALIESGIQVKPYSLDVLVTIILVSACLPLTRDSGNRTVPLSAVAAGTFSMWFSFPALFMLAGMGAVIAGMAIIDRETARLRRLLPAFGAWAVSAGVAYWFSIRPGLLNRRLARLDSDYLFPLHAQSRIVPWMTEAATNLGSISTSVRLAPVAALAFLFAIGLTLWRRERLSLLLAAPIALCLLAAIAQKYPWLPRLIFFAVPLTLMITARQVGCFVRERSRALRILTASIAGIALVYSGLSAVKNIVVSGSGFDDPRGAVGAIAKGWQPGDRIYASDAAMPCIIYYRRILHAEQLDFVSSRNPVYVPNQVERIASLPKTRGRLWFLYFEPNEKDFDRRILANFHQAGSLISHSRHKNFIVTLWDLSSESKPVP